MQWPNKPPRDPLPHERRVFFLALAGGVPAVGIAMALLVQSALSARTVWTLGSIVVVGWLIGALVVRERVVRPLQTLSNMLAALREGDFSLRARLSRQDDALGLALLEINLLGETLKTQRLGALEATSLLRVVMSEIDVAIFAFDDGDRLRLANRAAERLLAQRFDRLVGQSAASLGVAELLTGDSPRVYDHSFPERRGRWEVRRTTFRQDGRPHALLVITDVTKSLREEELLAWQRLVRVLSHEINNSLAPIKSIAGSLRDMTPATGRDADLSKGLDIIASRADGLSRFMSAYARLARLPAPQKRPFDLGTLVSRAVSLERTAQVTLREGPAVSVLGDPDQLEQVLINLLRNAVEASKETNGAVDVRWSLTERSVELLILDEGPGISGTANLFVPFFTTKPDGTGIGLVLSRQIVEGHDGTLTVTSRTDRRGAVATLRIPR